MGSKTRLLAALVCGAIVVGGTGTASGRVLQRRAAPVNILIQKNTEFDAKHGVSSGRGTKTHPFVIAGMDINNLRIENTSKWIDIHKNTINGQLVLDWVGDRIKVSYNRINDLRLNQNVARTGMPTTGAIVHNTFGVVGQLRHWDGLFASNTVGSPSNLNTQAVNFDGFNNARFTGNRIYGFVDARLHGHHHSSGYGMPSHMHAGPDMPGMVDHTKRYHAVSITNNYIRTTHEYALAYLDTNHAGNDRTAPSETNEDLNLPHAHHTHVLMAKNRLVGAGIMVNVFNADDAHHLRTYPGMLMIEGNTITLEKDNFLTFKQLMGIEVVNAKDVTMHIEHNSITGKNVAGPLTFLEQWDSNAGIFLHQVDLSHVMVMHNVVRNRMYGVRAENFTLRVHWKVEDLSTQNVGDSVYYTNVPNKPEA